MAKYSKEQQAIIAAKIRKVKKDHPEKDRKQVLGMAFGILKNQKKLRKAK
jgi:hypothetical protein